MAHVLLRVRHWSIRRRLRPWVVLGNRGFRKREVSQSSSCNAVKHRSNSRRRIAYESAGKRAYYLYLRCFAEVLRRRFPIDASEHEQRQVQESPLFQTGPVGNLRSYSFTIGERRLPISRRILR